MSPHSTRASLRIAPFRRVQRTALSLIGAAALASTALAACGEANAQTRTVQLVAQNDSGVAGTVSFTPVGRKTSVKIEVEPNGNLDMPAHIHPGTCDKMTPQPKFPLGSVKDGTSTTVVPATIDELFDGTLALNTHKSNEDLKVSTACVNLR